MMIEVAWHDAWICGSATSMRKVRCSDRGGAGELTIRRDNRVRRSCSSCASHSIARDQPTVRAPFDSYGMRRVDRRRSGRTDGKDEIDRAAVRNGAPQRQVWAGPTTVDRARCWLRVVSGVVPGWWEGCRSEGRAPGLGSILELGQAVGAPHTPQGRAAAVGEWAKMAGKPRSNPVGGGGVFRHQKLEALAATADLPKLPRSLPHREGVTASMEAAGHGTVADQSGIRSPPGDCTLRSTRTLVLYEDLR